MSLTIRVATSDDIDGIAAIYAREVREGTATFDTEPPSPEAWLAKLSSGEAGDFFLVAVEGDRVAGYAYSSSYRARPAYRHTRETSVYLAPEYAGRGVGRNLYDDLLPRLREAGVHTAVAGIALPNDASVRLHESVGFTPVGVMREVGFKFDRWIDVGWWQLSVGPAPTP